MDCFVAALLAMTKPDARALSDQIESESALPVCFIAFSDGEPVSTSPENALTQCQVPVRLAISS
jgi:hypothetical protein